MRLARQRLFLLLGSLLFMACDSSTDHPDHVQVHSAHAQADPTTQADDDVGAPRPTSASAVAASCRPRIPPPSANSFAESGPCVKAPRRLP